jgi:hypothetical protein
LRHWAKRTVVSASSSKALTAISSSSGTRKNAA